MATLSSKFSTPSIAGSDTLVATEGQTVFTTSYAVNNINVFLNGVKLVRDDDFTATDGTTVTLTDPAVANDVVEVISYPAFSVADAYTSAQVDALLEGYYTSAQVDSAIAANPSAYNQWSVKTGAYTAVTADQLACNGTFTVTLPASPSAGDTVIISNVGTGVITVGRNGSNINSAAEDGTLNADASTQLVYVDATIGWKEL